MRHNVRGRKLNRTASHRKMMFRNMVTELFRHERIQTTTAKAKEARAVAERLITYAKAGDLNSRRMAARKLTDPGVLKKLFAELGPRYADRPGGYTRVLKLDGPRRGDNADMSILELVEAEFTPKAKPAEPKPAKRAKAAPAKKIPAETGADDLTKIEGIGPKFAEAFAAVGVSTYADLAAKSVDELKELLAASADYASLTGRVGETWPAQAEMAARGKWDELKAWQDELDGGVDKS
ncbi:50S ribosomal protein L17 [bacterium]|nr:50S ribosomal protein L17 [bacterium]